MRIIGVNRSKSSYSVTQWRKGAAQARCAGCVEGKKKDNSDKPGFDCRRLSGSSNATFTEEALEHPFAQGAFKWVAKGTYVGGIRGGQAAVSKWFKSGSVYESHYFDADMKVSAKAVEIIQKFNDIQLLNPKNKVMVNIPAVWTFHVSSGLWAGQKAMIEPFIENYEKFNSNSGWKSDSSPWPRVMQALSHFSYHISRSNLVLCDLQGGVYREGVVLTDPVILSTEQNYGPTDLGPRGMSNFFSNHRCNEYCRKDWLLPKAAGRVKLMPYKKGSSMVNQVPTRRSRPQMTMDAIFE
eukprot:CAMPEP_0203784622 /NCGR_PEP_ID=MMETSP0100_2-20121128/564_1 /ASSEMBLY_ACC=CAM_ASM_000210 /TAXON_ID=96639 /ORGANISM=" , Strain NY0313808BC1" /LENGTH=295 /DNA_ID=CAMNT_0050686615 /DNA_START=258 /DNA_END=1146 /DNA_ORIENTATION=+